MFHIHNGTQNDGPQPSFLLHDPSPAAAGRGASGAGRHSAGSVEPDPPGDHLHGDELDRFAAFAGRVPHEREGVFLRTAGLSRDDPLCVADPRVAFQPDTPLQPWSDQ